MFHCPGLISSEMRYPTKTSKKKKRYVTFKCSVCGEINEQIYVKSRYSGKCKHCVQHTMTTIDFIKKCTKLHKNRYDYSLTKFRGAANHVTIICPIHGEFSQRAYEHLQGHGCIQCAQERRKETYILPKSVWVKRMEKYPLISFKDEMQIKNYHGFVDLVCKIHGDFKVQLGKVGSAKYLCAKCAYQTHQIQSIRTEHIGKNAYLYYVYLPEIDMYKFGVTLNKKERFKQLGNQVKLLADGVKEYTEAIRLEHKVFTSLDKYRYKGNVKLLKDGSTELFKQDVLKQIKRALQE